MGVWMKNSIQKKDEELKMFFLKETLLSDDKKTTKGSISSGFSPYNLDSCKKSCKI